jgi:hypothetical protein
MKCALHTTYCASHLRYELCHVHLKCMLSAVYIGVVYGAPVDLTIKTSGVDVNDGDCESDDDPGAAHT